MEKDRIFIKCQKCQKEFEYFYSGKGRKPLYCQDCKKLVQYEYIKRSNENKREKKNEELKENNIVLDTSAMKKENYFMKQTERTLELFGRLDSLRVEMCNLAAELGNYQSESDKLDQELLHEVETQDFSNGNEIITYVQNWKKERASRRNVKGLIAMLRNIISTIPMKTKLNAISSISNIKLKEKENEKI